jgi:hypothetical protein
MGIFDKAKDAVSEHSEQIDAGIDKAGDLVDDKTQGKYVEQLDQGQEMAKDKLRDSAADEPDQPA